MMVSEKDFPFPGLIFRFHVKLHGCIPQTFFFTSSLKPLQTLSNMKALEDVSFVFKSELIPSNFPKQEILNDFSYDFFSKSLTEKNKHPIPPKKNPNFLATKKHNQLFGKCFTIPFSTKQTAFEQVVTPPETSMAIEKLPFEDISPIKKIFLFSIVMLVCWRVYLPS